MTGGEAGLQVQLSQSTNQPSNERQADPPGLAPTSEGSCALELAARRPGSQQLRPHFRDSRLPQWSGPRSTTPSAGAGGRAPAPSPLRGEQSVTRKLHRASPCSAAPPRSLGLFPHAHGVGDYRPHTGMQQKARPCQTPFLGAWERHRARSTLLWVGLSAFRLAGLSRVARGEPW